jgi:hypothetical protein
MCTVSLNMAIYKYEAILNVIDPQLWGPVSKGRSVLCTFNNRCMIYELRLNRVGKHSTS